MATLATFVNRFVGARELAEVSPAVWTRTESPRLRPIANEDVYLFVKRIDNTAVARAADPAAQDRAQSIDDDRLRCGDAGDCGTGTDGV